MLNHQNRNKVTKSSFAESSHSSFNEENEDLASTQESNDMSILANVPKMTKNKKHLSSKTINQMLLSKDTDQIKTQDEKCFSIESDIELP